MLKRFWKLITSYPMHCRVRCHFVDVVSGQSVGIYVDQHGKEWLAEHFNGPVSGRALEKQYREMRRPHRPDEMKFRRSLKCSQPSF